MKTNDQKIVFPKVIAFRRGGPQQALPAISGHLKMNWSRRAVPSTRRLKSLRQPGGGISPGVRAQGADGADGADGAENDDDDVEAAGGDRRRHGRGQSGTTAKNDPRTPQRAGGGWWR